MKGFRERYEELLRGLTLPLKKKKDDLVADVQEPTEQNPKADVHFSRLLHFRSKKVIIGALAAVVAAGGIYIAGHQYMKAHTASYFTVYANGQEVGTVDNEQVIWDLYEQKEQEYKKKYPQADLQVNSEAITTVAQHAYKPEINTEQTLSKLDDLIEVRARGVQLSVEGKVVGILKNEAAVAFLLTELKDKYTTKVPQQMASKLKLTSAARVAASNSKGSSVTLESVKFNEDIAKAALYTEPDKIMDIDEALDRIMQGGEAAITYEVKEGDTISSIAQRFGVTQKDIFSNNPGIQERTLQIGTPIQIKALKPTITVRTVELVSEEIVIEPQVIIRKSSDLKSGESQVISPGQSGLKTMEYRLTKENGYVVAEEWLGQQVSVESKPKIVLQGTKIVGEGSGDFAWPVAGATMTSSYGKRWGRMHEGIDLVSSKRNILASDEGVVVFAGTKSGYGNAIIIDHKNGYETLYGHLSKIDVKTGQVVEQGETIGVMGNTGRSTGTHLHFEVHKNGVVQNPMTYL